MKKILSIVAAAVAVFGTGATMTGCGGANSTTPSKETAYIRSRAVWTSKNITSYHLNVVVSFQQAAQYQIDSEVRGGIVQSSTVKNVVDTGTPEDATDEVKTSLTSAYGTVDALFDTLNSGKDTSGFTVTADYQPDLGYPKSGSARIISGEAAGSVSAFSVATFEPR